MHRESFLAISTDEAVKFYAAAQLLHFGKTPVAVLEYEGRKYYRITKYHAQPGAPKDILQNLVKLRTELHNRTIVLDALHIVVYKLSLSLC